MKKKILIAIAVIVVCFIGFAVYLLSGIGSTYYYCQIDNSKIKEGNSDGGVIDFQGGMDYSYSLPAYDKNGNKKEIIFGVSRELKEGAFVQLTVVPIRGVIEWKEVQYEELPINVQSHYVVLENENTNQ